MDSFIYISLRKIGRLANTNLTKKYKMYPKTMTILEFDTQTMIVKTQQKLVECDSQH